MQPQSGGQPEFLLPSRENSSVPFLPSSSGGQPWRQQEERAATEPAKLPCTRGSPTRFPGEGGGAAPC